MPTARRGIYDQLLDQKRNGIKALNRNIEYAEYNMDKSDTKINLWHTERELES